MATRPDDLAAIKQYFAEANRSVHRLKLVMHAIRRNQRRREGKPLIRDPLSLTLFLRAEGEDFGPFALYLCSIDELELSTRARYCLLGEGIHSLGELTERSRAELLEIPNLGPVSLKEIKAALAQLGLSLSPPKPRRSPPKR